MSSPLSTDVPITSPWSNAYNRVDIAITDHAAGGISNNDRAWIERVEKLDL